MIRRTFETGGVVDFLWVLSFLLIGWAAWEQRRRPAQSAIAQGRTAPRSRLEELEATLPALVIAVLLITGFIMREQLPGALWNLLLPVLSLLAGLIAVREWWSWHVEARLVSELESSEARFRQVVDSNMTGIMFWRADGRVLDANDAFLEMTGYSREDLREGRVTWSGLTPGEFLPLCGAALQEINEHGICAPFEKEYIRKDGTRFPVLVGGARLPQERDQGVCFVIELSEAKAARRALDEVQERLQLFLDHSPALIFMKDTEGRYLHVNSSFEKLLQRPSSEVIGHSDSELFPPEEAAVFQANDEAVKRAGTMLEFQQTSRYPDAVRTNLVQKFPLRDRNGVIQAIGGIVTDITERHAAEEGLRRSEERYRSLVEGAPDAIFSLSLEGTLTSANAAAEAITGWSRNEMEGRPLRLFVHPDELALADGTWKAALGGEQPPPVELSIERQKGGYVILEFTMTPQFEENRVVEILGIGRDITERKQLEKQLRQAQRMESIGQLAGGVAHDFNNLLTVIQGHTSLLELNDQLDAESRDSISQIADAADRAANLTRQLLTFSRQQVMQSAHLDLNTVVGSMTKMLCRLLGEDVALKVHPAPYLPCIVADTGMIEQILMNLAVNARDAMPGGGTLTISTAPRAFTEEEADASASAREGQFVHLSVTDTGSGIAPEHLARIFEPFYTTKDIGKGTGLGLATVYGVVNQHRGWIEVESTLGSGTRFDIFLPAVARATSVGATETKPEAAIQRGNECILVVEDEAPLRLMVRLILEKFGYRVIEAGSGVQALETWRQHASEIALVLTDMVMPDGISGRELGARLLAERPELKVVYTSGYTDRFATADFILEEGKNFVQKPYQPEKLVRVIRENLDMAQGATSAASAAPPSEISTKAVLV
jgi:PAS domain S-box-containing protein